MRVEVAKNEKGQAALMLSIGIAAVAATALVVLGSRVRSAGSEHAQVRDALLANEVAEKLGVELRRYYDAGRLSATDCGASAATPGGRLVTVGAIQLCVPAAIGSEICAEDPSQRGRRFCVPLTSLYAGRPAKGARGDEPTLVARLDAPPASALDEYALGARVLARDAARAIASVLVSAPASAQRSDRHRPPAPPPSATSNSLGAPTAAAIDCAAGGVACVGVRICRSLIFDPLRYDCADDAQVVFQRYAFLPTP